MTILRFLLVGIVNTFVGLGIIYAAMYFFGMGVVFANAIGYFIGILVSFSLNKTWTFGSRDRVASSFLRYLLVLAVAYAVNLVTVLFVQSRFDLNNYLAQAMGIIPYALIGFLGSRYFAFRSQRGGTQGVNQENITPAFQENTCLRK